MNKLAFPVAGWRADLLSSYAEVLYQGTGRCLRPCNGAPWRPTYSSQGPIVVAHSAPRTSKVVAEPSKPPSHTSSQYVLDQYLQYVKVRDRTQAPTIRNRRMYPTRRNRSRWKSEGNENVVEMQQLQGGYSFHRCARGNPAEGCGNNIGSYGVRGSYLHTYSVLLVVSR